MNVSIKSKFSIDDMVVVTKEVEDPEYNTFPQWLEAISGLFKSQTILKVIGIDYSMGINWIELDLAPFKDQPYTNLEIPEKYLSKVYGI